MQYSLKKSLTIKNYTEYDVLISQKFLFHLLRNIINLIYLIIFLRLGLISSILLIIFNIHQYFYSVFFGIDSGCLIYQTYVGPTINMFFNSYLVLKNSLSISSMINSSGLTKLCIHIFFILSFLLYINAKKNQFQILKTTFYYTVGFIIVSTLLEFPLIGCVLIFWMTLTLILEKYTLLIYFSSKDILTETLYLIIQLIFFLGFIYLQSVVPTFSLIEKFNFRYLKYIV